MHSIPTSSSDTKLGEKGSTGPYSTRTILRATSWVNDPRPKPVFSIELGEHSRRQQRGCSVWACAHGSGFPSRAPQTKALVEPSLFTKSEKESEISPSTCQQKHAEMCPDEAKERTGRNENEEKRLGNGHAASSLE
eukprot:4575797-Pleurochrysis_carterae.AAC.1